jgi:hypothetical protein
MRKWSCHLRPNAIDVKVQQQHNVLDVTTTDNNDRRSKEKGASHCVPRSQWIYELQPFRPDPVKGADLR